MASPSNRIDLYSRVFDPSDKEIICNILAVKTRSPGGDLENLPWFHILRQIPFYTMPPEDIPVFYPANEGCFWFFTTKPRNRVVKNLGKWKLQSSKTPIMRDECLIGTRSRFSYYSRSTGRYIKTDWKISEFELGNAKNGDLMVIKMKNVGGTARLNANPTDPNN